MFFIVFLLKELVVEGEYKQAIIVRRDLGMSKGKIAAQVAHASLGAYKRAPGEWRTAWDGSGQKKVVLRVDSLEELLEVKERAEKAGLPVFLVVDAGRTQLAPGTPTSLGIGPAPSGLVEGVTGSLKLL